MEKHDSETLTEWDEAEELTEQIVVMTDESGNEFYYREDFVIPYDGKSFSLLVPIEVPEDEDADAEAADAEVSATEEDDEPDVFIARVDFDDEGEAVYLDPTEEEFEAVKSIYEEMMNDSSED